MRTTVTLADDVAAAIELFRRERGVGVSDAVNDLVRVALTVDRSRQTFRQMTHDLGDGVDVTNVAETLETLDGPAAR